MSGDTVIGQTLQFTNDNKFCYGYSGTKTTDGSVWSPNTELLNFTTASEYIIGKFYMTTDMITGNNLFVRIKFNGITVLNLKTDGVPPYAPEFRDYELVIPPFTEVIFFFWNSSRYNNSNGILIRQSRNAAKSGGSR